MLAAVGSVCPETQDFGQAQAHIAHLSHLGKIATASIDGLSSRKAVFIK
jgi:hypothetical protein